MILVTTITPTPTGERKTAISIGLTRALERQHWQFAAQVRKVILLQLQHQGELGD